MSKPDFSNEFPGVDPNLKIKADLGNHAHGDHCDAIQAIDGGTDQVRISPDGDVVCGTTNVGKVKIDWRE